MSVATTPASAARVRSSRNAAGAPDQISPYSRISPPPANDPFMAENPKVELHLESTDRRVDVIHEGFDIALRIEFPPLEQSDLVMKVLAKYPARLVASPALFERFARPLAPADLSRPAQPYWESAASHG